MNTFNTFDELATGMAGYDPASPRREALRLMQERIARISFDCVAFGLVFADEPHTVVRDPMDIVDDFMVDQTMTITHLAFISLCEEDAAPMLCPFPITEAQVIEEASIHNAVCVACKRNDLPLHRNGQCTECFTPEETAS